LEEQLPYPPPSQATTGPNPDVSQAHALRHLHDRLLVTEEQFSDLPSPSNLVNGWAIPATLPRLRVTPDKTKVFGPSHWLHTAEKVCIGYASPNLHHAYYLIMLNL
jgi:hypothetical protein